MAVTVVGIIADVGVFVLVVVVAMVVMAVLSLLLWLLSSLLLLLLYTRADCRPRATREPAVVYYVCQSTLIRHARQHSS